MPTSECDAYRRDTGCAWTFEKNCPGQSQGIDRAARITDPGYDCCCTQGGWKQHMCTTYMKTHGCAWTSEWSCPGQSRGSKGKAREDGSQSYECCCNMDLWKRD